MAVISGREYRGIIELFSFATASAVVVASAG
jgi:hypothetical protein